MRPRASGTQDPAVGSQLRDFGSTPVSPRKQEVEALRKYALLLVATAAVLALASGVALAAEAIIGTDGPDTIRGTNGDDSVLAKGGNDKVSGRGGEGPRARPTGGRPAPAAP